MNARVDFSKDGKFAVRAKEDGADSSMVPIHISSVLESAITFFPSFAEQMSSGDFDVPAEKNFQEDVYVNLSELFMINICFNIITMSTVYDLTKSAL